MQSTSSATRPLAASLLALALALAALLPAPSRAADDGALACLAGASVSDADLAHGATVVVVWASWSPRSRDIAERVSALAGKWGSRARVVAVSFQEDRAAVERFAAGKSFGAPICLDPDGAFARKYNIATLPGLVILKDGQAVHRGKLGDDVDQVLAGALR
jgi:thiol-disulfide isomerase/thioredoxin